MTNGAGWEPQQAPPPGWGQPQPPPSWSQPQPPPGWQQQAPPPGWGQPQPGGPGQWGPPPAEKPGIIPLRPLAVGEILDGAFSAIRQNPGATIGLTAVATTVVQIIITFLTAWAQRSSTGTEIFVVIVSMALYTILSAALAGALSAVVSEATLGGRMTAGQALQRIQPRLVGLIGLSIVVGLLTLVGLIGLIIGAVFVWVSLALSTPAYVLEGGTIGTAMRRSWAVVRGAWWRTFGILLLTTIIIVVVLTAFFLITAGIVIAFGGDSIASPSSSDYTAVDLFVSALLNIIVGSVTAPIMAGVIVLLYIERRIRLEGLDVTLAQAARDRAMTGQGR